MIRLFQGIVFLFLLTLDLNINAETIFYPKNCWGKDETCAVQNDSKRPVTLQLNGMQVHMDSQAIMKTDAKGEADLARGTLFAKHSEDFTWHTPFGQVICHACQVLLHRDEKSLEVNAIKGRVTIVRKGDGSSYELPAGFSVQLSAVMKDGTANLDFPQAAPLVLVGKAWARVYNGDTQDFKKEFGDYVKTWDQIADLSSQMQKEEAERRIASDEAEKAHAEKLRQDRLREQERIRQLFREKNYLQ